MQSSYFLHSEITFLSPLAREMGLSFHFLLVGANCRGLSLTFEAKVPLVRMKGSYSQSCWCLPGPVPTANNIVSSAVVARDGKSPEVCA